MTPRAPSIRSRLALLVLACTVPAALMAVMLIAHDYRLARTELLRSAAMSARATAVELDTQFAVVEAMLAALGTSPSLEAGDFAAFGRQADALRRSHKILNVVLEEPSGRQYVNTLLPWGAPLPPSRPDAPLRVVNERGAAAVTNLFYGRVSKRPVVAVGVPLPADARPGAARYTLSASMSTEQFGGLLAERADPAEWIAAVLDRDGTIVARNRDMARFVGKPAMPDILARLPEAREDAFESRTVDGVPVLAVMSRAPHSRWTVLIGIPVEQLNAQLNRTFLWLVAATVALMGSGLILAWRIGGRIADSVRGLKRPALALGSGAPVEPRGYGLGEADEVGAALVNASAMLRQAKHDASHDPLTGLANRAMFGEFLEQQLAVCLRNQTQLSVLYIDLDDFKHVNDAHGHACGDQLLQQVAERIKAELRKSDIAARLGGDEFAIVLIDTQLDEARTVAAKLGERLAQPYQCGALALRAQASIGVAGYPQSAATSAALLCHADEAMYRTKSARKALVGAPRR